MGFGSCCAIDCWNGRRVVVVSRYGEEQADAIVFGIPTSGLLVVV